MCRTNSNSSCVKLRRVRFQNCWSNKSNQHKDVLQGRISLPVEVTHAQPLFYKRTGDGFRNQSYLMVRLLTPCNLLEPLSNFKVSVFFRSSERATSAAERTRRVKLVKPELSYEKSFTSRRTFPPFGKALRDVNDINSSWSTNIVVETLSQENPVLFIGPREGQASDTDQYVAVLLDLGPPPL